MCIRDRHVPDYPEDMTGQKVVVIGGGAVGLDVVEFFAPRGAEVSIVEMMPAIGRDLDPVTKNDTKMCIRDSISPSSQAREKWKSHKKF